VTCEVTPHHLFLTQKDVVESARAGAPDPNLKMNPPLRSRKDLDALRQGLSDGSVDAIASDHAPHTRDSKARGFARAPFGVTGLETTLSLVLRLVEEGVVGLERGVELVSASPAEILGLEAGSLRPGSPADVTIVDPDKGWRVEPDEMLSRSANTAFAGWHLPGRVKWCLYRGEIVYGRDAAG